MKRVLVIQNSVPHYRKPLYNGLSNFFDITVLHSGDQSVNDGDSYKERRYSKMKAGRFYFQSGLFKELRSNNYDVVIAMLDIAWLNTITAFLCYRKKVAFIFWGSWLTNNTTANFIKILLSKSSNANIFYTYETMLSFVNKGVSPQKCFVANNTFDVGTRVCSFEYPNKFRILFVGTLNSRKQNNILLKAFKDIIDSIPSCIVLTLIGDGPELYILKSLSVKLGISERVVFLGQINDTELLRNYYKEALVSVSYGQAGLSVLQSLGYGVPFLTKRSAISGGEISNIKNKVNGIMCEESQTSLEKSLIEICCNIEYARKLGKNAFDYYNRYCSMDNMVQGFRDAIDGTNYSLIDETII